MVSHHHCCAPPTDRDMLETVQQHFASSPPSGDMVCLPGGTFAMGNHQGDGYPDDGELPVHSVQIAPFVIDRHAVSNLRFAGFVGATGYATEAERFGWSFVFEGLLSPHERSDTRRVPGSPWWCQVIGADWRHPEGADSGIEHRLNHPVIHVSWNDAQAFCAWTQTRLPTEAEWEYAARGGHNGYRFPWGNELNPQGKHRMNVWQGAFPARNSRADGHFGTAPVDVFPPNDFGLYNMTGNVWEWCGDWFAKDAYANHAAISPIASVAGSARVMRGGSYLCHKSHCNRYRVDARNSNTPDSSTGNLGFRCVRDRANDTLDEDSIS